MHAGLDRGEPLDQALQRLVHGFERVLRALVAFGLMRVQRFEIAPERAISPSPRGMSAATARATRSAVAIAFLARLAHLQGQLLDAALDRAEIAGALVRGLDPVGELHDAPFELLEGGLIARRTRRRR